MNTWRARHYSVKLNRRHRINITVRRFRLVRRQEQRQQLVLNVRLGRVRQLCFEHKLSGRRKVQQNTSHYRLQTTLAVLLIICGLSGITYSAAALAEPPRSLEPTHAFTMPQAIVTQPQPLTLARSTPTRITIASQHIDTSLVSVGLATDGSIELPPVLDWTAGWYKYSPTPGELGPSVIVGHVDSYKNISVFWRLRYVQAGDMIDVTRADGITAHFRITQLAQYDQNNFPTKLVYGNTTDAELRVITCGGTFDQVAHAYTQNTVVYATLGF